MADRSVFVRLIADTRQYVAGLGKAAAATSAFARTATTQSAAAGQSLAKAGQQAKMLPLGLSPATTGLGALAIAAGGSAKAAIDWESAWTGVTKTVEGSPQQMAALEGELRNLATTLPATHEEIAGVAEAAGQLGIETGNVAGFTKTMVDLGETTNLSAQEAATSLARFMNVMGTSQGDVDRLGSSVVDLGNNFATTEAEIVNMAQRISGAGAQIGLTEGDVLGLATALSSVGIAAEAGGTAISRVMVDMAKAVDTGSGELQVFAGVAGTTVDEFAARFRDDAGGAVGAFIEGLGRVAASGQSLTPILETLGFDNIRVSDALRRAALASDVFTAAMDTGNKAFDENTALAEEAEKRYDTMASRLDVAKNKAKDLAIELGGSLAPSLVEVAETGADALLILKQVGDEIDRIGNDRPANPAGMSAIDIARTLGELPGAAFNFPGPGTPSPGEAWGEAWKRASGSYDDMMSAMVAANNEGDDLFLTMGSLSAAIGETDAASQGAVFSMDDVAMSSEELAEEAEEAADAIEDIRDAIESFGQNARDTSQAHDDLTSAIHRARRPFDDLADAQAELSEAQDRLAEADTKAEKQAARTAVARAEQAVADAEAAITLKGNTEAAIENRNNMRALADQALATAAAFADGTAEGAKKAAQETRRARDEFIDVATEMGYTQKQAERLADKYGLIPKDVKTEALFISDEAQARIDGYKSILDDVPRNIITRISMIEDDVQRRDAARHTGQASQYGTWKNGKWVPKRADGGIAEAMRTYLVGEKGPELLTMGASSGYVTDAQRTRAVLSNQGGSLDRALTTLAAAVKSQRGSIDNSRHMAAQNVHIAAPSPAEFWAQLNDLAVA